METYKNELWEMKVQRNIFIGLAFVMFAISLWNGWRYREMRQVKEGLELKCGELIRQNADLNKSFDKIWRTVE